MAQRQLRFSGTAQWITDKVQGDLKEKGVQSVDVKSGHGNIGTITLHADDRTVLDTAVAYLAGHQLYRDHFRPA